MEPQKDIEALVARVRQIAYELHVYLGNGYLERVYENGLVHRMRKQGLGVETQVPLKVYDSDGFELGDYIADIIVENSLIVELKAIKALRNEHFAQIMNYLKTTGCSYGLLINFGSYKFEVRKVVFRNGRVEMKNM